MVGCGCCRIEVGSLVCPLCYTEVTFGKEAKDMLVEKNWQDTLQKDTEVLALARRQDLKSTRR